MKKILILILGSLACVASADSGNTNPGATLTTGAFTNRSSVFNATINPAVAALTVSEDEHWRLSYLPSLTFSGEVGDVNNFADDLDELIDILDDPSLADDSIDATLDRFNRVLEAVGDHGYAKVGVGVTAPLFPLYWKPGKFSGTFFAELALDTQVRASVLDEILTYDDQNLSFSTGSSIYLKSGIEKRFGLGYAQPLFDAKKAERKHGQLYGGVKIKIINLELSKQVMRLQQLEGRDIEDVIEDEYENNLVSTTGLGIDLGLSWVAKHYSAGLVITNINSPSFDYGAIGVNCAQYPEGSFSYNNCEAAAEFANVAGRIKTNEKHTKHAVATIDGSVNPTPMWAINAAVDLAKYDDLVGSENQWLTLSTSLNTLSLWIPDLRLGYQKNLAGAKLASVGIGLSLFDTVSLDARIALDDVIVDDEKAPRSMAFSLAFEEKF